MRRIPLRFDPPRPEPTTWSGIARLALRSGKVFENKFYITARTKADAYKRAKAVYPGYRINQIRPARGGGMELA